MITLDQVPEPSQDRFTRAYGSTPHFRGHIVQYLPLIIGILQLVSNCLNGQGAERLAARREERLVRRIRKGGRFARNVALGEVRNAHPDVPSDQQAVLADNLVAEWSEAPEDEIRQMVDLAKQVRE